MFHDIELPQEGEGTQVKPVFLFHEGDNRYGFIHTSVRATLRALPLSSAITRFSWDPMSETPYTFLSTVNWTPTGANSTIISGADTQTDLIVVASRQDQDGIREPLMVVRLAKAILSDGPQMPLSSQMISMASQSAASVSERGYQIRGLIQGDGLIQDDGSIDIKWKQDAVTVHGAKISKPLSFLPDVETRLFAVTLGRNGSQVPRRSYEKVFTYLVEDEGDGVREPVAATLTDGYEFFENLAGDSWRAYELTIVETIHANEPAVGVVVTFGSPHGSACDPTANVARGGCDEGLRCRLAAAPANYRCQPYQGRNLGRGVLKFNGDGTLKRDPWSTNSVVLKGRDWQLMALGGFTYVSWVEEDGLNPPRLNLSRFTLGGFLCAEQQADCPGPNVPVGSGMFSGTDADGDGVDQVLDCDDADATVGRFDADGELCTPSALTYGPASTIIHESPNIGYSTLSQGLVPTIVVQKASVL